MRAEQDDEMRPEYDWSNAVRGRYANRFTPAEREEMHRRAWPEMVQELSTYTVRQVRELEAALFTFFVLARHEPVQKAARHAAELLDAGTECRCGLVDAGLLARLRGIAVEREWVQHPATGSDQGREGLQLVLQRLEAIYDEVRTIRERVEQLLAEQLESTGMSRQEIERRTEETARLWRAA